MRHLSVLLKLNANLRLFAFFMTKRPNLSRFLSGVMYDLCQNRPRAHTIGFFVGEPRCCKRK
jgi:hypothetical protein